MKNFCFFLLFSLLAMSCFSQDLSRGKLFLSANIGDFKTENYSTKYEDSSWTAKTTGYNLHISPKIGYFVIDKLVFGLEALYGTEHFSYVQSNGSYTSQYFSAGLFTRYYFQAAKFAPFAEAGAGVYNISQKFSSNNTTSIIKSDGYRAHVGAGLAIFVGEKAALEGMFEYYFEQLKYADTQMNQSYRTAGLSFTIGASFVLN